MREESWVVANMLMFIGGSGSTAGGIKVVTFIVLVLIVITEARGGRQAEAFGRTIPSATLRQALSVTFIAGNTVAVATLTLMALTPFSFEQCLFEVISAFSIVGLSTGITPSLPESAQLLTGLMYVIASGRSRSSWRSLRDTSGCTTIRRKRPSSGDRSVRLFNSSDTQAHPAQVISWDSRR